MHVKWDHKLLEIIRQNKDSKLALRVKKLKLESSWVKSMGQATLRRSITGPQGLYT